MCRAFNFCNPQKVEAIIEYLFDHFNKKKSSVVKFVLKLFALSAHILTLIMALNIINNTGPDFLLFFFLKPHFHRRNLPQGLRMVPGTPT